MENENITAAEGKPSGYKVTKKDLRNANWRWVLWRLERRMTAIPPPRSP